MNQPSREPTLLEEIQEIFIRHAPVNADDHDSAMESMSQYSLAFLELAQHCRNFAYKREIRLIDDLLHYQRTCDADARHQQMIKNMTSRRENLCAKLTTLGFDIRHRPIRSDRTGDC